MFDIIQVVFISQVEDTMPHSSQQVLDNLFDDPHPPAIDILVQQTPRSSTRR